MAGNVAATTTKMTTVEESEQQQELNKVIAKFYDESSEMYEKKWGEHMHSGFYDTDAVVELVDQHSAKIRMIEEVLSFASVSDDPAKKPKSIVDVGCGIGGSSMYLARKYEAECHGINLSPVQVERAQALADAQGMANKVSFQVADALNQPFPDGKFDLVWSLEIAEHIPDKKKLVSELARVAAPGATIILVSHCHRDLSPTEKSLRPDEEKILNKLCSGLYLSAWCSSADYVKLFESFSLQDVKAADWSDNVSPYWPAALKTTDLSDNVSPSWPAAIKTALSWKGIISLLRGGWKSTRGTTLIPLMIEGFKKDIVHYSIITCKKPK